MGNSALKAISAVPIAKTHFYSTTPWGDFSVIFKNIESEELTYILLLLIFKQIPFSVTFLHLNSMHIHTGSQTHMPRH